MKNKDFSKKTTNVLISTFLAGILLCGCGDTEAIDCPYTDLGWDTTEEELFKQEGEYLTSYKSTYGGTTYTYEGSYMDKKGTIKYMYDEDGVLMNVAWAYSSNDADELKKLYNKIHENLVDQYGESGYQASATTNYGDTWDMDEGNILLSVMNTTNNKALQIAYVNPEHDKE